MFSKVGLLSKQRCDPLGGSHVHLVQYTPPLRETRCVTDQVVFSLVQTEAGGFRLQPDARHAVPDAPHLAQVCPLQLKPHEKALILSFDVLYAHNDFEERLHLYAEPMFEISPDQQDQYQPEDFVVTTDDDLRHPDETGTPHFSVAPRGADGVVHPDSRCIYRPRYCDLGFNVPAYAGLETHVLNAHSTCISVDGLNQEYEAFLISDPFMVYLLENRQHFSELRDDDIVESRAGEQVGSVYLVKRALIERVQQFFRHTLFPLFHYTRNDAVRIAFRELPTRATLVTLPTVVTLLFQLEFIVVAPGAPGFKARKSKLEL